MAFEQLSIYTGEAMFILGDYHYESFLYHLNPSKVMPGEQAHMAEVLTQLKREKQFGDFDFLVFHPQCGVIVVGLCSVNSNSDVQVGAVVCVVWCVCCVVGGVLWCGWGGGVLWCVCLWCVLWLWCVWCGWVCVCVCDHHGSLLCE